MLPSPTEARLLLPPACILPTLALPSPSVFLQSIFSHLLRNAIFPKILFSFTSSGCQGNEALLTHLDSILVPVSGALFPSLALREELSSGSWPSSSRMGGTKVSRVGTRDDKGHGRGTASVEEVVDKGKDACRTRHTGQACLRKGAGGLSDLGGSLTDSMDGNTSCSADG